MATDAESTPSLHPPEITAVATFLGRYEEACAAFNAQIAALRAEERAGAGVGSPAVVPQGDVVPVDGARAGLRSALARFAEVRFAPVGAILKIDDKVLPDLEPGELWRFLERRHGNCGRQIYMAIAQAFVRALWLQPDANVKLVGGRPCFRRSASMDSWGPSCRTELRAVLACFRAVGETSGICWGDGERADEVRLREALTFCRKWTYPPRFTVGDAILVVTSKHFVETRLDPRFAAAVQLFLAEHNGFSESLR